MKLPTAILATLVASVHAASACKAPTSVDLKPTVSIDSGVLVGTNAIVHLPSATAIVNKFLGIPFAAPPKRFELAEPAKPWNESLDASKYGSYCFQNFGKQGSARVLNERVYNFPPPPGKPSEDCLNLNVFTPKTNNSKPVLFWIYGGGFDFGASSLPFYDGTGFAANQDIVVVTFNYRTNVFGFSGSPELPIENQNLGLHDQRLALDWTRRNIAAFGGDPEKITIAGESAGAGSVEALVAYPPEPVPFHGAIMESGLSSVNVQEVLGNNGSAWKRIAEAANCSSASALECIRSLPAKALLNIVEENSLNFEFMIDNITWAAQGRLARIKSNKKDSVFARVPILLGNNGDEGSLYTQAVNESDSFVKEFLGQGVPDQWMSSILKVYARGAPGLETEGKRAGQIMSDFSFGCPSAIVSNESSTADIPTWRYFYNASFPNQQVIPNMGAFHSAEIPSVFGTYLKQNATSFQAELSKHMQTAWANFIKNPMKGPGWNQYPKVAVLGDGARPGESDEGRQPIKEINNEYLDARCPAWKPVFDVMTGLVKIPTES